MRKMAVLITLVCLLLLPAASLATTITFPNGVVITVPNEVPDFTLFTSIQDQYFEYPKGGFIILNWLDEATSTVYSMLVGVTPKTPPWGIPLAICVIKNGEKTYYINTGTGNFIKSNHEEVSNMIKVWEERMGVNRNV